MNEHIAMQDWVGKSFLKKIIFKNDKIVSYMRMKKNDRIANVYMHPIGQPSCMCARFHLMKFPFRCSSKRMMHEYKQQQQLNE